MEISSIPVLRTPESRERAKTIGVPAALAAGSVLVATKTPKGVEGGLKLSTRLGRSAKAGIVTAAVVGLLTLNREKIAQGIDKVKGIFNKNKQEAPAETQAQMPAELQEAAPQNLMEQAPVEAPAAMQNSAPAQQVPLMGLPEQGMQEGAPQEIEEAEEKEDLMPQQAQMQAQTPAVLPMPQDSSIAQMPEAPAPIQAEVPEQTAMPTGAQAPLEAQMPEMPAAIGAPTPEMPAPADMQAPVFPESNQANLNMQTAPAPAQNPFATAGNATNPIV